MAIKPFSCYYYQWENEIIYTHSVCCLRWQCTVSDWTLLLGCLHQHDFKFQKTFAWSGVGGVSNNCIVYFRNLKKLFSIQHTSQITLFQENRFLFRVNNLHLRVINHSTEQVAGLWKYFIHQILITMSTNPKQFWHEHHPTLTKFLHQLNQTYLIPNPKTLWIYGLGNPNPHTHLRSTPQNIQRLQG